MILIKRFLLIIIVTSLHSSLSAQTMLDVYADYNHTDGGVIGHLIKDTNCVIIAGSTVDSTYVGYSSGAFRLNNRAFVKKIDENGNTLWSIVPKDSTNYSIGNAKAIITRVIRSGNYIYAYFLSSSSRRLFKIEYTSGNIIWNKTMPAAKSSGGTSTLRYNINYLVDYDSTKLILTYEDPGLAIHQHLATFIDKQSGNTLSTYQIGRTWGSNVRTNQFAINKDSLGSLYYTSYDTLVKTYHANHDSILWKSSFDSLGIGRFQRIHIDEQGELFVFGSKSNSSVARVAKVNPANGHPIWHTFHVFSHSIDLYDFIDKSGYFYTIWRNNTTATGKWNVLKIAKSTGTNVWTYNNVFASSSQAPLALDLDSAGNVYTTGSFGSDLGPGNWRIIKLNGTTGTEIFKTHIITDSTQTDVYSWGLGVAVLNNKPCFFGELQINYEGVNSKVRKCFVRLNPTTGQIVDKKWLGGKYQYQSKTIAIQPSASKETFVLKQFSNKLSVQDYDANNQLLWNTDLVVPNKVVLGKGLKLAANGDLLVMSFKASVLSRNPFYSPSDSVSIYRLDPNGNLLSTFSFDHTSTSVPFEIVSDAQNGLFVFYKNNSDEIFLKSLNSSGAGSNVSLGLDFDSISFLPKIAVDYSPNNLMVFGRNSGTVKAVKVTKSNLAHQVVSAIPNMHRVGYTQLLKKPEILICGQSVSGEEIAVKYNTAIFDTVWSRVYPNNAEILKFLVSEDSNHIYTISNGVGNSVVRKIDVSNGANIWSHTLTGTPRDLTFNSENNELRIVGTTVIAGAQHVWSERIDTSGALLGGFNQAGFSQSQNIATCVAALPNGSIWAGGSISDSILGKAGFLMELATSQLYFAEAADTACGQLISPSGNYTWNSSGIYTDTVFSANGVDTVFTIEAIIQTTDTSVTQNGHTLSANLTNASYQWLDCDANYAIISGETAQAFTPQTNGNFAVEVSKDGCTDTSACFKISGIGILENEFQNSISVFPNPSHGIIHIELSPLLTDVNVRLLSLTGQIIESSFFSGEKNIVLHLPAQAGIYLVEVSSELLGRKVYRVSKL